MARTIKNTLVSSAVLLALAGTAAMAQGRGPAQPSRDPSGQTTIGQSTLPITSGGGGGAAAAAAHPVMSYRFRAGQRPMLWHSRVVGRRPFMATQRFGFYRRR